MFSFLPGELRKKWNYLWAMERKESGIQLGLEPYKLWFSYGFCVVLWDGKGGVLGPLSCKLIWRGYPKVAKRTFVTVGWWMAGIIWRLLLRTFVSARYEIQILQISRYASVLRNQQMGLPIPGIPYWFEEWGKKKRGSGRLNSLRQETSFHC